MFTGHIKITPPYDNCTISNTSDTLYLKASPKKDSVVEVVSPTDVSHDHCISYIHMNI